MPPKVSKSNVLPSPTKETKKDAKLSDSSSSISPLSKITKMKSSKVTSEIAKKETSQISSKANPTKSPEKSASKVSKEVLKLPAPEVVGPTAPLSVIIRRSYWTMYALLVPLLLSPLLLYDQSSRCLFVLFMMIFYWLFEPISLYMTSFLPVMFFPLLGVASTKEIAPKYMGATNMMFVSGLIFGIALEHSNLHRRIALKTIVCFGSSLKNLMAGVMAVTAFLSMWINNTATTAMMVPIVDSILQEIFMATLQATIVEETTKTDASGKTVEGKKATKSLLGLNAIRIQDIQGIDLGDSPHQKVVDRMKHVRKALLFSIAYSSSIGGTSTLTGTGTNLVFDETFHSSFPDSTIMTFTSWFAFALPTALITLVATWVFLYLYYFAGDSDTNKGGDVVQQSSEKKYKELGSLSFHEGAVLVHFILLVLLWFLRDPGLFPGWQKLFTDKKGYIKDAVPAFVIALSMFTLPANLVQYYQQKEPKGPEKKILNWAVVQQKMSWGVVFLLGGGFALAHGTKKSGLNDMIGKVLGKIDFGKTISSALYAVFAAFITNFASNVATASLMLPVITEVALAHHVNPLFYLIPATQCISYAFMLPVGTPPNAIVYETLKVSSWEMVKPGFFVNILSVVVQLICLHTFGRAMFKLDEFPDWAYNRNNHTDDH